MEPTGPFVALVSYPTTAADQARLADALARAVARRGRVPGLVAAQVLASEDGKSVVTIGQWRDRSDFERFQSGELGHADEPGAQLLAFRLRTHVEGGGPAAVEKVEPGSEAGDSPLREISHEIRNALVPIVNGAYMLGRAAGNGDRLIAANEWIARHVNRLLWLVEDLLDLAEIGCGRVEIRRRRLELNDLVRSSVERRRPLFEAGAARLDVDLAPAPVYVEGDRDRVAEAVDNLLRSAARLAHRGGRAWLSLQAQGGEAVLCLREAGTGGTAEDSPHVPEPISACDEPPPRGCGDLRFGLAFVEHIVKLHGGTVAAAVAAPGAGAELTVRLPLAAEVT
jgi:signal transduction histidine kinase